MKIAVLLSGGVDSSVALRLLADQGHDLTAFYLKIWLEDELSNLGQCPWEEDLAYARAVCEEVGAPLEIVPMQREYHRRVVRWAVDELAAGRTPSPDILCNQLIKFGVFLEYLQESGTAFDRVASGHYARIHETDREWQLFRGVDPVKDQTYFLFQLDQHQLGHCLFPLGERTKPEVRELARQWSLPNRDRPDSQGICFLGKFRYDDFVRGYLGDRPGDIVEANTGTVLGTHRGPWFHTIGQRKGLGLSGGPWYVVGKDMDRNIVEVSHFLDLNRYRRDRFHVPKVHWIGRPPEKDQLQVKVRHGPRTEPCRCHVTDRGLQVTMETSDPGISPGQVAVFYDRDRCLGGGMIVAQTQDAGTTGEIS